MNKLEMIRAFRIPAPSKMEPKYRTWIQAALIAIFLALMVVGNSSDKSDSAGAQKSSFTVQ